MTTTRILLLLALVGVIGFVFAWDRLRPDDEAPPAPEQGDGAGEDDGELSEAMKRGRRRLQKRLADMHPRPDERERPGPKPAPTALDKDQVPVSVEAGGAVTHDGTRYDLGAKDEAVAEAAAKDLRRALMAVQTALGGDKFREADGRSKLTLVLSGVGALRPDELHRLLAVCGEAPLRLYRYELDLGGK